MARSQILLTFDYELFLGRRSGSVENCLLSPTRQILQRLQKRGASALFFVDATYLHLAEAVDPENYDRVADQVAEMAHAGCEIGFHLHPHWLDAVTVAPGEWSLSNLTRYRLHSLEPRILDQVFRESYASLQRALRRAGPSQQMRSFRAGGWCLQPFQPLRNLLLELGLTIDSSVTPGLYKSSLPAHFYDYRSAPAHLDGWRFEGDPCVPAVAGRFVEIPVSAFRATLPRLVANGIAVRHHPALGDGQGVASGRWREMARKLLSLRSLRQLTLEMCTPALLQESLRRTNRRELRVFASHPKMMSQVSLDNLNMLLTQCETVRAEALAAKIVGNTSVLLADADSARVIS